MPVEITSKAQLNELLKANSKVVIDFYAEWCGPCKLLAPKFVELSEKYKNIVFCKVDADVNEDIVTDYKVSGLPTIIFFHKETEYYKVVGANLKKIENGLEDLNSEQ
jgi:thioredoxin 1